MYCEVCEKPVLVGKRVKLEGSIVVTCEECARLGEVVGVAGTKVRKERPKRKEEPVAEDFDISEGQELIDDYSGVIRKAREKSGLKQEELAKMVNEPASLIHRIEGGRVEPNLGLGKKLENKLGVRLFKKTEEMTADVASKKPGEITLGDVVVVRKRK